MPRSRSIFLCQTLEQEGAVRRTLSRQVLRAGPSIGANVEEAQAGQSREDFIARYSIALKKARETIYWLRFLRETGSLKVDELDDILREAREISRILGSDRAKM